MIWKEVVQEVDDAGHEMCVGSITLRNDKSEYMASVVWFDDEGPFYAYVMDGKNIDQIERRFGPCTTLEGAKRACEKMMTEGRG